MKMAPDSASCATVLSGKSQLRIVRSTGAWDPAGIRGRPSSVAYGHLCPALQIRNHGVACRNSKDRIVFMPQCGLNHF